MAPSAFCGEEHHSPSDVNFSKLTAIDESSLRIETIVIQKQGAIMQKASAILSLATCACALPPDPDQSAVH